MRFVLRSGSSFLRSVPALAALALLLVLPITAGARIGAAEVREGPRGGPCFTITPREERQGIPEFQSIMVSDGRHLMWKMTMPRERSFPLGFAMCVPYGGKVASLPRTEAADLARQRDGSIVVHQIMDGDREGTRRFGCLPRAD